jgi:hypothetical protein
MKAAWQSLPKQPRAALQTMKTEQEKGEIKGALPGARFTKQRNHSSNKQTLPLT